MPYFLPSWVSETCILAGWITAMLFATLYTLKAPWWLSQMGRNLFGFDLAVAMALTPGFVKYAFDATITGEFYQWFVVGDLVLVTMLVAHRGFLLLRVQKGWNWQHRDVVHSSPPDIPAGSAGKKESL